MQLLHFHPSPLLFLLLVRGRLDEKNSTNGGIREISEVKMTLTKEFRVIPPTKSVVEMKMCV